MICFIHCKLDGEIVQINKASNIFDIPDCVTCICTQSQLQGISDNTHKVQNVILKEDGYYYVNEFVVKG